jgi:two-component system, chemotaxis family, protein-glutamate methylesterase/glutaminase
MNDVKHQMWDAVVIGTSAGGIKAVSDLLAAIPSPPPFPIMVVQHLPSTATGTVVQVVGKACALTVKEALDKEKMEAGSVYFAPANYHLLAEKGGVVALTVEDPVHFARPSIDVLFESAAYVYRSRLLAVILTGANSDGTAGAAIVKAFGGAIIAQDPSEAEMPAMPEAAIQAGVVDAVLSISDIAKTMVNCARLYGAENNRNAL